MKKTHYNFRDDSNDKEYFTMVPNYILNHSTAVDQSLYIQIKKHAGEKGECFVSEKNFCLKLGIGRIKLHKSLEYLLNRKWIEIVGYKEVMTKGGIQKVKVYKVNDIWKINMDYYEKQKGVSETTYLESKGVSENSQRGVQNDIQGVSRTASNNIHIKEEPIKEEDFIKRKENIKKLKSMLREKNLI